MITRFGDAGVRIELPDQQAVHRFYEALRAEPPLGLVDLVPAARTVLLTGEPATLAGLEASARRALARISLDTALPGEVDGDVVTIPVHYDGADLQRVARATGLEVDEVIRRHSAPLYRVAFCGFAPGFAYLEGLDPDLRVPRLPSPRTSVPALSVAMAERYTAVYPRASPGGWNLLGSTDLQLFDLARVPPSPLRAGTGVRFEPL